MLKKHFSKEIPNMQHLMFLSKIIIEIHGHLGHWGRKQRSFLFVWGSQAPKQR